MRTWLVKNQKQIKKTAILLLKIAVSVLCLWYISRKINFTEIYNSLLISNWFLLLLALASFIISKILASYRLNIYFRQIGLQLSGKMNLKLYWLGMFYNLFLPGSISGDAYKVIRLSNHYTVSLKKTTAAVLLDRLSGLFALCILSVVLWVIVFKFRFYSWAVTGFAVVAVPVFYLVIKKYFKYFLPVFWSTFMLGFAVQVFQIVCMLCIILALNIPTAHLFEYLLLFLISSVVAVLPITIGGLGAREMIFYWGAGYFLLDMHLAVTASILFYFSMVVSSLSGMPFVFLDPLKNKNEQSLNIADEPKQQ